MVEDKFKKLEKYDLNKKITQAFKNKENTFLKELLDCIRLEFNELQESQIKVEKLVLFEENEGIQLDYLGSNIKEKREGDEDQEFLNRIIIAYGASSNLGDDNSIINLLSNFLDVNSNQIETEIIDVRKIRVTIPGGKDIIETTNFLNKIKVAGVRTLVELNKYWSDLTYEEIENLTYEELEKYRYERKNTDIAKVGK
ncbi:MAG: hypothetical protein RR795_01360 [Cetobacterium sp.]|uniref:hypothetical protein n=1 Tax=Cetobacterium sp. TaxID=2071632 RepID=UPI002FCAFEA0